MFFTHISASYSPKNKLHEAIQLFLQSQERKVIPGADLPGYIHELSEGIDALNAKHPKATPVTFYFEPNKKAENVVHGFDDIRLRMGGICHFHLYKAVSDQEGVAV